MIEYVARRDIRDGDKVFHAGDVVTTAPGWKTLALEIRTGTVDPMVDGKPCAWRATCLLAGFSVGDVVDESAAMFPLMRFKGFVEPIIPASAVATPVVVEPPHVTSKKHGGRR